MFTTFYELRKSAPKTQLITFAYYSIKTKKEKIIIKKEKKTY
jgi:hypothetical protein